MPVDVKAQFADALRDFQLDARGVKLGIAVSGGGDSMALLHLAIEWSRHSGAAIFAATVDHGLRQEAAAEAAMVAEYCRKHQILHVILRWAGWDKQGNLQDAARQARKRLLGAWATENNLNAVLLGHTADDQAETVLMRLARGSGVDGLAGIRRDSGKWARPLLDMRRESLRGYLRDHHVDWVDDPSNTDERFDRIKARNMLQTLGELGLTVERLTGLADHMRGEADVLHGALINFANAAVVQDNGDLLIDRAALTAAPQRLQTRILAKAFQWVSTAAYPPRFTALDAMSKQLGDGLSGTLHGCYISSDCTGGAQTYRIGREFNAVASTVGATDGLWDGRWQISGPAELGYEVRVLGEIGLNLCPNWRETGLPRTSLLASPAVWDQNTLIAAPIAGYIHGWNARIVADFHSSLVTH